jgi:hypothetical protein
MKIFVIVLLLFWIGLLPFWKAAHDLPYSSQSFVASQLQLPTAWNAVGGVFGQNQLATLWSWPNNTVYSLGASIGISFNWLIPLLGILPVLIIGFWGMYFFSGIFMASRDARLIAALFFLTNSYILLVIDGGQLLWGLAYGIIPWCLVTFYRYINQKRHVGWFLFCFILLSFADLRAIYLLGIILVIYLLIEILRKPQIGYLVFFIRVLLAGLLAVLCLVLLHAYWLLPLLMSQSSVLPSNLSISSEADFLSFISLSHAFVLQQPHWYLNIFGQLQPIRLEFIWIPLLIIPIFINKRWLNVQLLVILLVGVFLAKGNQPPLGSLYAHLLNYIPGFFLFRDSSKFFILIALVYAVSVGLLVQQLEDARGRFKKYSRLLVGVVVALVVLMVWPTFTGQMTGLLGFSKQVAGYQQLEQILKTDSSEGRVLWISSKPPLGYMDQSNVAINAVDLIGLRPFSTGIRGTYETLNFLREASYSGQLLQISGIKKLVYAFPDPNKKYKVDEQDYYDLFLQQLQGRDWVSPTDNSQVLNLQKPQPLFHIPQNYYLVVGSDALYGESTLSAQQNLVNNGLIFVEEEISPDLNTNLLKHPVLLYKKELLDVAMQLVDPKYFYFPSQILNSSPNQTGWWKRDTGDFLSFHDFLKQKYQIENTDFDLRGGWAVSEGQNSLTISKKGTPNDIVLIRLLESSRSGELSVEADNQSIKKLNTSQGKDQVQWRIVGSAEKDFSQLTLKTTGDIHLVNAIAIVPKAIFNQRLHQVESIPKFYTKLGENDANDSQAKVVFEKLNDDQYQLEVTNLSKPSLIVFNQRYDPKWTINGQPAIPVYSIFNGFFIDKNGTYLVEYSPHRYLFLGGMISTGSLLLLIGSVVYRYYADTRKN